MGSHTGRQSTAAATLVVTPDDDNDLPGAESCVALYIGGAGNLSYDDAAGNQITGAAVVAGPFLAQVRRVRETGTTATGILSFHDKAETQPSP